MNTWQWNGTAYALILVILIVLLEHYLPWREMLRGTLSPIARYVLGVLAINLPFSGLLITWGAWPALWALWIFIFGAGLATAGAYALDSWLEQRARMEIAEQEATGLRPDVGDGSPR